MNCPSPCRACGSHKFWRVNPVMLPQFDSNNAIYTMPAVCRSSSGGTASHEWGKKIEHGNFAAWICVGCGLTDWFAVGVNDMLSQLARNRDSGVTYVDGEPQGYR